jgi:eukaryotic-like serine/threonine-protein kinase
LKVPRFSRRTSNRQITIPRIIDHSGIVWNCFSGRIWAWRVRALAADKDFLTLWKDADPDIPILKQAKAEYANLH